MRPKETWITDFRPLARDRSDIDIIPYCMNGRNGYMPRWKGYDAPAARLPSPVRGWHEIHIGFWGASAYRLRLSSDPWFTWVESTVRWDRGAKDGEEAFWKIADLTGVDFEFLPLALHAPCNSRESQIAYLRLVPLSEDKAHERVSDLRNRPTRTAGAVLDGAGDLWDYSPQSPDEVRGTIASFIDSDFKRIHWACTCTTMRMGYLTRIGYYMGQDQDLEKMHTEGTRRGARALLAAERGGYDPLEVLIAFASENGLELWPSFRIQQDYAPDHPHLGYELNSPIVHAHPEWRHVDRQGKVCSFRFSHFHEGWEQYKLDLLGEIARKGPPGIHLNLMCERDAIWDFAPHAVERFKKECGLDPCATDDPPMEWYRFRCDHLTAFMRRFRSQTNAIAKELGKPIAIAVQVSGDRHVLRGKDFGARAVSANLIHGFDIAAWAKEGLVDVIAPSFRREYRPMFLDHLYEDLGEYRRNIELAPSLGQYHNDVLPKDYDWSVYFTDLGAQRKDLVPFGDLDPWRILREANDMYQQGADSVDVWEMGGAPNRLARWNVLKHVGDRDMLAREFGARLTGLAGKVERPVQFTEKSGQAEF